MAVSRCLNRPVALKCLKKSLIGTDYQLISTSRSNVKSVYVSAPDNSKKLSSRSQSTSSSTQIPETLDLSFNDGQQAYRSKYTWEILRGWIVFQLCSINYLVENNHKLMKLGKRVLGQALFEKVMKATFYGQFVAGPDEQSIQPVIENMRQHGVKAILDYSAEEDISEEEASKAEVEACQPISGAGVSSAVRDKEYIKYSAPLGKTASKRRKAKARTYFYLNEAQCEKNTEIFLQAIEAVSNVEGAGFAAIKVTALGRPQLLLHLSEVIARVHRYIGTITGVNGTVSDQHVQIEKIKKRLEGVAQSDPTVKQWLDSISVDKQGNLIHVIPWGRIISCEKSLRDALKIVNLATGKLEPLAPPLTDKEEEMFLNMMRRLHTLFKTAKKLDVRVMVDAEQTYFQPAISRLAMEMSRVYNTEKAIVFNTYQCYLKNSNDNLCSDLDLAEKQNFFFGAKLVRGAYMEQERERAATLGYNDPINHTFEETTVMYERNVIECMRRIRRLKKSSQPNKICIMAATHNEDTVRFVLKNMKAYGIKRSDRVISFGQLYGMCDQVSFPLGQFGYSVYKYVPYGPVAEVLPYLSRRTQENKGVLAKIKKEKRLLIKEFLRRVMKGQFFYKPKIQPL